MRVMPMPDRQRASRIAFPTLTILAWSASMLFCWIAILPTGVSFASSGLLYVVLAHLGVVAAAMFWMTRQLMQGQGHEAYDGTPDSGWRAGGLVYYNPADAAVMVQKRFGWGWTFNFARPATWVVCAALVVLVGGIGMMSHFLK